MNMVRTQDWAYKSFKTHIINTYEKLRGKFISRNRQFKLSYLICSIFEIPCRDNFDAFFSGIEYSHRAKYHNSDFPEINLQYFHDNKVYHAPHNCYDFRVHPVFNNQC